MDRSLDSTAELADVAELQILRHVQNGGTPFNWAILVQVSVEFAFAESNEAVRVIKIPNNVLSRGIEVRK